MAFLNFRKSILILLFAVLPACKANDPKVTADLFWNSIYSNNSVEIRKYIASDASSVVISGDLLPLQELENVRIKKLKLQSPSRNGGSNLSAGLAAYEDFSESYSLGEPIYQNGQILIPTSLFSAWGGERLVWHLQTRLVIESGEWKVDFVSLKYSLQQQLESENRDVLLSEARSFSETMQQQMKQNTEAFLRNNQ